MTTEIDAGDLNADPAPGKTKQAPTPDTTGLVEVSVGGSKFMVTPQMAQSINQEQSQRQNEVSRILQEQNRKFDELKTTFIARPEQKKEEGQKVDFWSDPDKYFEKLNSDFDRRVEEKVNAVKSELTNQYQTEQSTKQFWDSFYKSNDDLKNDDFIVKAVMARDWNELKDLKTSDAQKEIAERTRQQILGYMKPNESKGVQLEGSSLPRTKKAEAKEEKVTTISDQLRARAQARRKAAFKQSA